MTERGTRATGSSDWGAQHPFSGMPPVLLLRRQADVPQLDTSHFKRERQHPHTRPAMSGSMTCSGRRLRLQPVSIQAHDST